MAASKQQRALAARLVAEGGQPFNQMARSVGISERRFRAWRSEDRFLALVSEARRAIAHNQQRRADRAFPADERVADPITPSDLRAADPFRAPRALAPPRAEPTRRRELSDAQARQSWLDANSVRLGRMTLVEYLLTWDPDEHARLVATDAECRREAMMTEVRQLRERRVPQVRVITC